jgi:hypothetical protein
LGTQEVQATLKKRYLKHSETLTDFLEFLEPKCTNIHAIVDKILKMKLIQHSIIFENIFRDVQSIEFIITSEIEFVAVLVHGGSKINEY